MTDNEIDVMDSFRFIWAVAGIWDLISEYWVGLDEWHLFLVSTGMGNVESNFVLDYNDIDLYRKGIHLRSSMIQRV